MVPVCDERARRVLLPCDVTRARGPARAREGAARPQVHEAMIRALRHANPAVSQSAIALLSCACAHCYCQPRAR